MRLSVIILVSMPKSGTIISVLILSFVIFDNPGDKRRRLVGPHFPRLSQIRHGRFRDSQQAELPPQLRPFAPEPTRLRLGRHQDEAEGGSDVGFILLFPFAVWRRHEKDYQDEQEIQVKYTYLHMRNCFC